jgi:iron complex outermembrane receptor protein
VYRGNSVYYVNYRALAPGFVIPEVAQFNFVAGVPVTVKGAEAEASFQILPRWSVSGNVSYADGQIEDGLIACTDLNGDGVPDTNVAAPSLAQLQGAVGAGQNVSQCPFSGRSSLVAEWTANLQTEASFGLSQRIDGFVRGLATYTPSNSQDPGNTFDNVDSYALVNLYAGIRDPDGRWEISLFAKNVFEEEVVLSSGSGPQSTSLTTLNFGPGGSVIGSTASSFAAPYYSVGVLAERELGVNLRIGFGSR